MKPYLKYFLIFLSLTLTLTAIFQTPLSQLHKKIIGNIILNNLEGYNKKSYLYCEVYFTKKDTQTAELTALMLSDYYKIFEEDFSIKPKKPIIVIYPNEEEIKKALNGAEQAPMGAYYGGVIHLLSPKVAFKGTENEAGDFLKQGAVIHELAHYFVDEKTKGNYYIWFSEGVALYYEFKLLGSEWHRELRGKVDYISLKRLKHDFRDINEIEAYRRSFELIEEEMEGKEKEYIVDLCNKYMKNCCFN